VENIIRVYDRNMRKLAYLQNAYNIGYELTLNELWYATFTLPADDPKNIYCQPFNYVEIYDGRERIELFRIMPSRLTRNTAGDIVYQCEHVLATLLDDVLFKYHQIGGGSIGTVQVLRYILDQQLTSRWQLGICEFDRRFQYKWENENLLAALFSVPQPFDERYRWEFDTTGTVWRLHLRKLPAKFKADIVYRKNMTEIQKEVDPTSIVTRLYCLGYGEGDNQLGIESVNNGVPYLQANGEATTWGIKSSILVDRRFESAETLKAYGQALLNELKNPYKSYGVRAVDLHRKTPDKYERFFPGDIVRIIDKEDNIIEDLPIVKVSKSDITGNPGDIQVEIANKSRDIAGSISELQDRTRINEVYAQGATNLDSHDFADNCDPNYPAVLKFYIQEETARINKVMLSYAVEAFRAYSKAIEGGGGIATSTASGGGSSQTSSSGGGVSTSTASGGGATSGPSSASVTATNLENVSIGIYTFLSGPSVDNTRLAGGHNHGLTGHTHGNPDNLPSGSHFDDHSHPLPNHGHTLNIGGHSHQMPHTHSVPNHTHGFSVPDHVHGIDIPSHKHDITLPNHDHSIEYGIFRGPTPTAVTVEVDGNIVPGLGIDETAVNIIPYLNKDDGGRVSRGSFHEIKITPNDLGRIVASVNIQLFVQSRGGGDY
jgi:phage minor structural protein